MDGLLFELQYNEIISAEIAVSLRRYIASRNPNLSPFMRANIFADAVNRIVDSRLPKFSEGLAKRLKENLFNQIALKQVFSINCADVFKAAVRLKTLGYEFFRELSEWLSALLKKTVARESLFDLVIRAHRLMNERPDADVSDILDSVERSTGGLKFQSSGSGEQVKEYIRTQVKERAYVSGETVHRKRAFAAPALAAAALSLILLAAGITNAATNDGKGDLPALLPAAGLTYASLINADSDGLAASLLELKSNFKRMRATAYDLSVESCGKRPGHPQYGITSSGTKAVVGRTVAVDPEVIPLGSRLFISFPAEYSDLDGVYMAEDTGRLIKGDSIDIFFGEDTDGGREVYERAMKFGVRYVDVRILD